MYHKLFNIDIYWLCGLTFVLAAASCAVVTPLVRRMAFAEAGNRHRGGRRRRPGRRQQMLRRQAMMAAGGNVYYLAKFAGIFGLDVQDLGAQQTGMTKEQFKAKLLAAGS